MSWHGAKYLKVSSAVEYEEHRWKRPTKGDSHLWTLSHLSTQIHPSRTLNHSAKKIAADIRVYSWIRYDQFPQATKTRNAAQNATGMCAPNPVNRWTKSSSAASIVDGNHIFTLRIFKNLKKQKCFDHSPRNSYSKVIGIESLWIFKQERGSVYVWTVTPTNRIHPLNKSLNTTFPFSQGSPTMCCDQNHTHCFCHIFAHRSSLMNESH